jgi:hypothetical protein
MKTPNAELPRRRSWGAKAVGALVAIGVALAVAGPAAADDDDWDGRKHWKKHGYYHHPGHYPYGHYKKHKHWKHQPHVVYVQPQPVYVAPPPVYYQPPPVYYQPAPVYYGRPNVSIVFPIDLD